MSEKAHKKIYALDPAEREKVCDHKGHMAWSGRIPCTGVYRCTMCGYVDHSKD